MPDRIHLFSFGIAAIAVIISFGFASFVLLDASKQAATTLRIDNAAIETPSVRPGLISQNDGHITSVPAETEPPSLAEPAIPLATAALSPPPSDTPPEFGESQQASDEPMTHADQSSVAPNVSRTTMPGVLTTDEDLHRLFQAFKVKLGVTTVLDQAKEASHKKTTPQRRANRHIYDHPVSFDAALQ